MSRIDWAERRSQIIRAGDDGRERLSDAYQNDWIATYLSAFVSAARARRWGFTEATEWANEIAEASYTEHGQDAAPEDVAANDVLECEAEAASV